MFVKKDTLVENWQLCGGLQDRKLEGKATIWIDDLLFQTIKLRHNSGPYFRRVCPVFLLQFIYRRGLNRMKREGSSKFALFYINRHAGSTPRDHLEICHFITHD